MRWAVWFLIVNVVANSIAGAIVSIIGCIPPDLFWKIMENPEAAAKNCLPQDHLQIFWDTCGAHVIASDIAIWVLPIPMVWQLKFSKVTPAQLSQHFVGGRELLYVTRRAISPC
jgi:hypothetical protein